MQMRTEAGVRYDICDACEKKDTNLQAAGGGIVFCPPCWKVAATGMVATHLFMRVVKLEKVISAQAGTIQSLQDKLTPLLVEFPKLQAKLAERIVERKPVLKEEKK